MAGYSLNWWFSSILLRSVFVHIVLFVLCTRSKMVFGSGRRIWKKKLCSKKTNRGERIDRHDCWSMRHRIERELKKNTHRKEEEKEWIPRDRNRFNVNNHDECIDFFPLCFCSLFQLPITHTHTLTQKNCPSFAPNNNNNNKKRG